MSTPANLLDSFRSYSYHHILAVCDGTETAEKLAMTTDITQFQHERAEARFCAQEAAGGGKYTILIDGTSDAHFTIKSAKWSSVLFPREKTGNGTLNIRTLAVDGEIVVKENFGINFMNVVSTAIKSFGADPNGVVYVLKTIFVGHTHDGQTEMISNVRPLLFFMIDINAKFDMTGAEYVIGLVGCANGATRLPHFVSVSDGFAFEKKSEMKTLGEVFDSLGSYVSDYYNRRKTTHLSEMPDAQNEWIDVQYEFQLDPAYRGYSVGDATPASGQSIGDGDAIISIKNGATLESVINQIMQSSKDVMEKDQEDPNKKYIYKISTAMDTSPDLYKIVFHIHRMEAVVKTPQQFAGFSPKGPQGDEQGIIFDYIFTGKNVDVLDFDIEMNMGLAFFQTLLAAPSAGTNARDIVTHYNPQPPTRGIGQRDGPGDDNPAACSGDTRRIKKPFFLGTQTKDASLRNSRVSQSATSYEALLTRHAALENIECSLKIRGNPQLLEETTQLPSYLRVDNPNTPQVHGLEDRRPIMPSIHTIPAYVKVNVMMPSNFNATSMSEDYAEPFWYQGWYFCLSIDHEFSDGDFTQTLELFSLPIDDTETGGSAANSNAKESDSSAADDADSADSGYDQSSSSGSGTSTSTTESASERTAAGEDKPSPDTSAPSEGISVKDLMAQRVSQIEKNFQGGSGL